MTIRDFGLYSESAWQWTFVNGQLPGKVQVSDLDGILECHGHFLAIEGKHPKGRVSKGQDILLRAIAGITDHSCAVVVWGHPRPPVILRAVLYRGGNPETIQGADNDRIASLVSRWFRVARIKGRQ